MNWIKVTDALPEDLERVIMWDGTMWRHAVYCDDQFHQATGLPLNPVSEITHWMRITPPEE